MARLVKPLVILVILAGLGVLFVRSAQSTRAEPYTLGAADLTGWTLTLDPNSAATGTLLMLRAPDGLGRRLFTQVFSRAMETFTSPAVSSIPVVLVEEYRRALADVMSPGEVLAAAGEAGVGEEPLTPACMAWRRDDQPGAARQLYFVVFEAPAVEAFRRQLADAAGGEFEAETLSPVLMVAAGESALESWLPLAATESDCLAAVEVS